MHSLIIKFEEIYAVFEAPFTIMYVRNTEYATKLKRSRTIRQRGRGFVWSFVSARTTFNLQNETISQPIAHSVYDTEIERLRANVQAKTAEFSFARIWESFPSRDDVVGAKMHSGIPEERRKPGQKLRDSKSFHAPLLRRNFRVTIINELATASSDRCAAMYFFAKASEVCD